jgi:hypothetical protein
MLNDVYKATVPIGVASGEEIVAVKTMFCEYVGLDGNADSVIEVASPSTVMGTMGEALAARLAVPPNEAVIDRFPASIAVVISVATPCAFTGASPRYAAPSKKPMLPELTVVAAVTVAVRVTTAP